MKVNFYSKSILSLLDLTTIGGSNKLGDETKIGQFCSGLKYALALFLRNGIEFRAETRQVVCDLGGFDRTVTTNYSIDRFIKEDEFSGDSKELISINANYEYESFHTAVTCDEFCEDVPIEEVYETGISTELGFDWKLEFALREIWSNMIDENGWYDTGLKDPTHKHGTIISLTFSDDSEFAKIWEARETYFITSNRKPLIEFNQYSQTLQVYRNVDGDNNLKIYKQGILVYENTNESFNSDISFNINFGRLDERRILLDYSNVISSIASILIKANTDEEIEFIFSGLICDSLSSGIVSWSTLSQEIINHSFNVSEIKTFPCVIELLKKLENSPLQNRKVTTLKESVWEAQKEVTVLETTKEISEKEPIKLIKNSVEDVIDDMSITIQNKIQFEIIFPIKEATIVGSVVVADKFNKVILINSEFDLNNDKHLMEFIIQYFDLTNNGKGNIVHKLAKYILKPYELK